MLTYMSDDRLYSFFLCGSLQTKPLTYEWLNLIDLIDPLAYLEYPGVPVST